MPVIDYEAIPGQKAPEAQMPIEMAQMPEDPIQKEAQMPRDTHVGTAQMPEPAKPK